MRFGHLNYKNPVFLHYYIRLGFFTEFDSSEEQFQFGRGLKPRQSPPPGLESWQQSYHDENDYHVKLSLSLLNSGFYHHFGNGGGVDNIDNLLMKNLIPQTADPVGHSSHSLRL